MTILMKIAVLVLVAGFGFASIAASNPPWGKVARWSAMACHSCFFAFLALVAAIVWVDL